MVTKNTLGRFLKSSLTKAVIVALMVSCSGFFGENGRVAEDEASEQDPALGFGRISLSVYIPSTFSSPSSDSRVIAPETTMARIYLNGELFAEKALSDGTSTTGPAGTGTNWAISLDVPIPIGGKYSSIKLVFLNAVSQELSVGEALDVAVSSAATVRIGVGCLPVSAEQMAFSGGIADSDSTTLQSEGSRFYAFPVKASKSYSISSTTASAVRISLFDGQGRKVSEAITPNIATQVSASAGTWYVMANSAADIDSFILSVKEWNQEPIVAAFSSPAVQGMTGNVLSFTAPQASDPEGTLLQYSWRIVGPSPSTADVKTATSSATSHSFAAAGEYSAILTVADAGDARIVVTQKAFIGLSNVPPVAVAGLDRAVNAGTVVPFDASGSTDLNGDPMAYDWDFGDGSTGAGRNPGHLFSVGGVYIVTLRVSDPQNAYSEDTLTVTVNAPPVAKTGANRSIMINDTVAFSGSLCSDPENDPLSFSWDFGDGSQASSLRNPMHKYTMAGSFLVTLVVADGKGLSSQATVGVNVREYGNPIAEGSPASISINAGGTASFNATASYAPSGAAISFDWDFGDGSAHGTTATTTHTYVNRGIYTAVLTVTEAGTMKTGQDTVTVNVNGKPTARAVVSNQSPVKNVEVRFNGVSSADPENDALTYEWDFGDSTAKSSSVDPVHVYANVGMYTASLIVKDTKGLSDTASLSIFVREPGQPKAEAGEDWFANPETPLTFSGEASRAFDGATITAYAWSFGDGSTANGVSVAHAFAMGGTYTVTLTVTDSNQKSSTDSAVVRINKDPTAKASASALIAEPGVSISFSASGSSDPDGDSLSYSWDFGDGATGSGASANHAYLVGAPDPGLERVATLTVTDSAGLWATSSVALRIIAYAAPTADAGADRVVDPGAQIAFTGAASRADTGLGIVRYLWDFGDGTMAIGRDPVHSFAEGGPYTVTLTVTDNKGKTASDSATVTSSSYRVTVAAGAGTVIDASNPLLLMLVDRVGNVNIWRVKKLTAPGTVMIPAFSLFDRLVLLHDIGGDSPYYDTLVEYMGKGDFGGAYYATSQGKVDYNQLYPVGDPNAVLERGKSYSLIFRDVAGSISISFQ